MTASATSAANTNEAAPETVQPVPVAEAPAPKPEPAPMVITSAPVPVTRRRRPGRLLLMLSVPLVLAAGGAYVWATGGRYEETDNANLRQAKLSIAAEASGRITTSNVADNMRVKAGDTLFVIDPAPYRIALEQADAALASARLNVEQLRAGYSQATANENAAAGDVTYYQGELDRQTALTRKGVSTQATLDSARRDLKKAQDALSVAQQAAVSARAALGGNPDIVTDRHPAVLSAQAARDKAALDLSQTTVTSPSDGVVYQAASFKPGQFVATGTSLFTLVETGENWVDANFKETQLEHMKVGQEAEVVLDTFPDHALKATIQSIGAGTGAEFSLLPAQNATGNWVKVTQRIPVRLLVESPDANLLLRTGMSATVTVDTGKARGLGSLVRMVENWVPGLSQPAAAAQ